MLQKPKEICQYAPELENIISDGDIKHYAKNAKREIEQAIAELGLRLRKAELKDYSEIYKLLSERFNPPTSSQISFYDSYRSIRHGYKVVLEDSDGKIVGYDYSLGYDDDDKTSFGLNIAISPLWSGYKLQTLVSTYTSLIGMERGSRIRRGIVHPANYSSLHNLLNNTGFLCEQFFPYLPGFESSRFILSFGLTPSEMMNNRIDQEKLLAFVNEKKEGVDFVMIECNDEQAIADLYQNTSFRVVAFIKEALVSEKNLLFAVPYERMGFPSSSLESVQIR
ncbi:MAG: hypothetical protein HYZ42_08500 [Bacteroidetes bacterium]|nr:hypothetical protein [Bacteroidota bacterium]